MSYYCQGNLMSQMNNENQSNLIQLILFKVKCLSRLQLSSGSHSLVSFLSRSEPDTLSFGQRNVGLGSLSNHEHTLQSVGKSLG